MQGSHSAPALHMHQAQEHVGNGSASSFFSSMDLSTYEQNSMVKKILEPLNTENHWKFVCIYMRAWSHCLRLPKIKAQALDPVKPWQWLWWLGLSSASLGLKAWACTTLTMPSVSLTNSTALPSHLCPLLLASPRPSEQHINDPTISPALPPLMCQDVFSQLHSLSMSVMAWLGVPF